MANLLTNAFRRRPPGASDVSAAQAEAPRLVIVGNGMVGWKLCQALVARGRHLHWQITALGAEPRPAYDRVRLTDFFSGKRPDELLLAPRFWYERNRITLRTGAPVLRIDRENRCVELANGESLPYDRLVLATGSRPFVPPLRGAGRDGVFVYRTIEDLEAIRACARVSRRAAVLGGGLLGLEAAKALLDLGLEVTVLERGPGLMARQLTPDAAALLRAKIEALGVRVCPGRDTVAVEAGEATALRVACADGEAFEVDLFVIAAGIVPNDELARACGLPVGKRGGIEVDDTLSTVDLRIHAIGECAVHRGMVYGLAAPGYLMAEVLAERLSGALRSFSGAPLSARLKLLGVDVASFGESQDDGESIVHRTPETYRELIFRRGRLVGGLSVGPYPEAARLQDAVERRQYVWPWKRRRYASSGRLWPEEAAVDVSQWPPSAVVCNCTGVTRGQLSAACRSGCTSVEALASATGASTVCGSCRPLLGNLVGVDAAPAAAVGVKQLLAACALVVAVVAFLATAVPPLVGQSLQFRRPWEFLLLDPSWRQVTGFSVLGCAVLSLVLSLRKRIARITWGDFAWWRLAHVTLGILGLVTLVAHTGLRLGSNFNRVLMVDFLGLTLLGACAGAVTALERRLDPRAARRLRSFWTWAHVLLVWPLPVLVGFHILAAYYF
ncbi:MAG TPA: FAD-dependent oxidoreductase [Opitutaceae bacterium]